MERIEEKLLKRIEIQVLRSVFPEDFFCGKFKVTGNNTDYIEIGYRGAEGYFKLQIQKRFIRIGKDKINYDLVFLLDFISIEREFRILADGSRRSVLWLKKIIELAKYIASSQSFSIKFLLEPATPDGRLWVRNLGKLEETKLIMLENDYNSDKIAYGMYINCG